MNKKLKQMKPPHPGKFIFQELWELELSVDSAAEGLGVRPHLARPPDRRSGVVPGNGHAGRKGFWPQHGYPAAHAGMP